MGRDTEWGGKRSLFAGTELRHRLCMVTVHFFFVVAAITAIATLVWGVAALLNRPQTVEHDLRRRTLTVIASLNCLPIVAATSRGAVAVTIVVAWAIVVVAALRLVVSVRSSAPGSER